MNWHKLSEEKPTEEGLYVLATHGDIATNFFDLKGVRWAKEKFNITHWLKIEPPKEDK